MSFDHLSDESIDLVLSNQPVWAPPPGFAAGVVAGMPAAHPRHVDAPLSILVLLRAAVAGALVTVTVYAVGILLAVFAKGAVVNAPVVVEAYGMLLTRSVGVLMAHSPVVSWISAGLSIGVGLLARPR